MKKEINNLVLIILEKKQISIVMIKILFLLDMLRKETPYWYRSANLYLHLAWIEPTNSQAEAIASGLHLYVQIMEEILN